MGNEKLRSFLDIVRDIAEEVNLPTETVELIIIKFLDVLYTTAKKDVNLPGIEK